MTKFEIHVPSASDVVVVNKLICDKEGNPHHCNDRGKSKALCIPHFTQEATLLRPVVSRKWPAPFVFISLKPMPSWTATSAGLSQA